MYQNSCLACGGARCERFLEIPGVPVFCNILHPTAQSARDTARGDLSLAICHDCGHVFNTSFDPERIVYSGTYENSLHHSPRFQAYAEQLAHELVKSYGLTGGHVVEIASGQGDFLRQLCTLADCKGTGYDPSYRSHDSSRAGPAESRVRVVAEPFDEQRLTELSDVGVLPSLILCRQALEHFTSPHGFLTDVGAVLPRERPQPLFFEVPNSLYSLQAGGIWDFIYEHVSYFCAHSLAAAFKRAGFAVSSTQPRFGGQFLSIAAIWPEARTTFDPTTTIYANCPSVSQIVAAALELASVVRQQIQAWQYRFNSMASSGKAIVIWGAGSKGVTFLNLVGDISARIRLVDINPSKHGMHAAGTGIPIESPDELKDDPPSLVIVMNPLYTEEIRAGLASLGIVAECEGV